MLLEEPDVRADALLEARELEEVDRVDGGERGVGGVGGLDARAEARGVEREHAAAGVVEDGAFAGPQELLGDDHTAASFTSNGTRRCLVHNTRGAYILLTRIPLHCE